MRLLTSLITLISRSLVCLLPFAALAGQQAGVLYDPQPPADSAYLRVLHLAGDNPLALSVDGKQRIARLAFAEPSDYLVLPQGRHTLRLQAGSTQWEQPADLAPGRAYTLALGPRGQGGRTVTFEDATSANRLKAMLTVYHLAWDAGPLDVTTADGSATVFGNLAPGSSRSVPVNPIEVELAVARSGEKAALAHGSLSMQRGGAYSLFILPAKGSGVALRAVQNRTERYGRR